jgi:hypothetical protein
LYGVYIHRDYGYFSSHHILSIVTVVSTMSGAVASFTKEHTLSERSLKENNRERKKRVVVTGGSGRLGRCVVREMVEHGWEVYNRK